MKNFISLKLSPLLVGSLALFSACSDNHSVTSAAGGSQLFNDEGQMAFDSSTACTNKSTAIIGVEAINLDTGLPISSTLPAVIPPNALPANVLSQTMTLDIASYPHFALKALYWSRVGSPQYMYYGISPSVGASQIWQEHSFPLSDFTTTTGPSTASKPWAFGTNGGNPFMGGWIVAYDNSNARGCQLNFNLIIKNTGTASGGNGSGSGGDDSGAPSITPPGAPGNFSASVTASSQIALSWSAPTSGSPVTSYTVRRNDGIVLAAPGTSVKVTDSQVAASQSYSYTLTASNSAGFATAANTSSAFVPPNGTATAPPPGCDISNPVTLAAAKAAASGKGTASRAFVICLGPNTYTDSVALGYNGQDNYEVWQANPTNPNGVAEINGKPGNLASAFVLMSGAKGLQFSNLYIHDFTLSGININTLNGASGIIIENSHFKNIALHPNDAGIVSGQSGAIIGTASIPPLAGTSYGLQIVNNLIEFTGCFGIDMHRDAYPVLISKNTLQYTGWYSQTGIGYNECAAIYVQSNSGGGLIENNIITNFNSGVNIATATGHSYPDPQAGNNGIFQAVGIELDSGGSVATSSHNYLVQNNAINAPWDNSFNYGAVNTTTPNSHYIPSDRNGRSFACVDNFGSGNTWKNNNVSGFTTLVPSNGAFSTTCAGAN